MQIFASFLDDERMMFYDDALSYVGGCWYKVTLTQYFTSLLRNFLHFKIRLYFRRLCMLFGLYILQIHPTFVT